MQTLEVVNVDAILRHREPAGALAGPRAMSRQLDVSAVSGSPMHNIERAAKPLATALDKTLNVLMEERIHGFREHFESMARAIETNNEEIGELHGRIGEMERAHQRELAALSRGKDAKLAEHMAETERMLAEELGKIGLQLEGTSRLGDIEQLTEQVEELEKSFAVEVTKRHTEVGEINEVLKGLEALFESWEIQMADQRRAQIQKNLRSVIFRLQHQRLWAAFSSWTQSGRQSKKMRHLLSRGIGSMRNRRLALHFGPWHAYARAVHKSKTLEALESIDGHKNTNKAVEDRIHELTARLDDGLADDSKIQVRDIH